VQQGSFVILQRGSPVGQEGRQRTHFLWKEQQKLNKKLVLGINTEKQYPNSQAFKTRKTLCFPNLIAGTLSGLDFPKGFPRGIFIRNKCFPPRE
jgi:hypothetical protein